MADRDGRKILEHAIQTLAQFISHARGNEVPPSALVDEADRAIRSLSLLKTDRLPD